MDLGFIRRRQGLAGRTDARLDYGVLVATLEAMQSASPAARAEVGAAAREGAAGIAQYPLVELVLGGPGWREALGRQGGCFSAAHATRRGNGL